MEAPRLIVALLVGFLLSGICSTSPAKKRIQRRFVPPPPPTDTGNRTVECPTGKVACNNSDTCIKQDKICDGHIDCLSSSDEQNCENCGDAGFLCDDGGCIPFHWKCDDRTDCSSGEDEYQCYGEFCERGYNCSEKCLSPRWKCDGFEDCDDGEDEDNCD